MSTPDIIFDILNVVILAVLVIVPLSAVVKLTVAAFSPRRRLSLRVSIQQHPLAHTVWFVGALFFGFLLFFVYASGRAETRAKFINFMNDLKEAHYELQHYGSFTNQFRHSRVYSWTNCYVVGGTNYWCEFRGEHEEFRDRGFLVITTNQIFLWIDKKQGVIPLLRQDSHMIFPPGI